MWGGRNREGKCCIPLISPPALCTKTKVAKEGGGRICAGHYGKQIVAASNHTSGHVHVESTLNYIADVTSRKYM